MARAANSSVNFAMWAGDENINNYVQGPLWTQLLLEYNVSVKLIPLNATSEAVDIVTGQMRTNAGAAGTIDLIWRALSRKDAPPA